MDKRLIDANAIEYPKWDNPPVSEFGAGYRDGKVDAICEIRALAPTVDAVEVVRCKDCMYCTVAQCGYPAGSYQLYHCHLWAYEHGTSPNQVEDDDFCSYGCRRENEHG